VQALQEKGLQSVQLHLGVGVALRREWQMIRWAPSAAQQTCLCCLAIRASPPPRAASRLAASTRSHLGCSIGHETTPMQGNQLAGSSRSTARLAQRHPLNFQPHSRCCLVDTEANRPVRAPALLRCCSSIAAGSRLCSAADEIAKPVGQMS